VLSFRRPGFEDFTDNLVFNIVGSLVPLVFASVVAVGATTRGSSPGSSAWDRDHRCRYPHR